MPPPPLLLHEAAYLLQGLLVRPGAVDGRTEMHVDPPDIQYMFPGRLGEQAVRRLEPHPEFVFLFSGGRLGMGIRVNVRIYPQGHRRLLIHFPRHVADAFQLRGRFHIEHPDACPQSLPDFRRRLSHAGKDDLLGVCSGLQRPIQLSSADNVESAAALLQ